MLLQIKHYSFLPKLTFMFSEVLLKNLAEVKKQW